MARNDIHPIADKASGIAGPVEDIVHELQASDWTGYPAKQVNRAIELLCEAQSSLNHAADILMLLADDDEPDCPAHRHYYGRCAMCGRDRDGCAICES